MARNTRTSVRIGSPVEGLNQSRVSRIMAGDGHIGHLDLVERIADSLHIPGHLLGLVSPVGSRRRAAGRRRSPALGVPLCGRWGACQIFPAIAQGETAKIGYICTGGQFADELYWRQSVFRPTNELHLRLRLHGVEALTGCSAVEERPDGSELTATESLTWHRDKDGIVIDLSRRDLRSNQAVTLRWDVARATA